ncbi:unnamed protein product [Eruca vesicaria subsp. sativa]|uniref:Phytochrome chromophore attachment site domain-containing protein n=1 Tax=Eruca vesicaria subsp. sativa TaxID=29727 RepID=A0ABC8JH72_ERUVS|nr:unnamed protein product [Eruca vesicaria subsp. sativa]
MNFGGGDGVTVNTEAFERAVYAISKISKNRGGHLIVPPVKGLCFLLYLHTAMEKSFMDLVMVVSFMGRISKMSLSQMEFRSYSLFPVEILSSCVILLWRVRDLTGYDRVMVYKFHEDKHGEVVAGSRGEDLEPYIALSSD